MKGDDVTRVAIAVVESANRFLVGVREPGVALSGFHEFPGGKLEPGETPEQSAARECLEEAGLEVVPVSRLNVILHEYSHGHVELTFVLCHPASASPCPPAGRFEWVERQRLPTLRFPDANRTIIESLCSDATSTSGLKPGSCA
jgi:8-oxo-dGTP diphosphatase